MNMHLIVGEGVVEEEVWLLCLLQDRNVMVVWAGKVVEEVWPLSLLQDLEVMRSLHWIAGEVVVEEAEVWFLSLLQD